MSTTTGAGAQAPVDLDAVIAEQTEDVRRLRNYPRTHAARLKAIDDHIGTECPAELGASAAAAGAEARQHMAGRLVRDTKAEAQAAVQGYTKRAELLADSLKAIPREQLDHARLANLRADIASQLESPPPSLEIGLDPRLSLLYDSWQRASETGDAEVAHAVRIVGGPVATNIRRQTAASTADSADGRMSRTLDAAFREHSGRDATHSARAAIEQHRRLGLELAQAVEGMQHVATGRNPTDALAGFGDDWAEGLAGIVPLRRNRPVEL